MKIVKSLKNKNNINTVQISLVFKVAQIIFVFLLHFYIYLSELIEYSGYTASFRLVLPGLTDRMSSP